MSLSCLSCQVLQRTNSDCEREYGGEKYTYKKIFQPEVHQRSWSGNLGQPPPGYDQMVSGSKAVVEQKKVKKLGHRRMHSTGALALDGTAEPRLVRSCGMRRDWSFEDLRERDEKKGRMIY